MRCSFHIWISSDSSGCAFHSWRASCTYRTPMCTDSITRLESLQSCDKQRVFVADRVAETLDLTKIKHWNLVQSAIYQTNFLACGTLERICFKNADILSTQRLFIHIWEKFRNDANNQIESPNQARTEHATLQCCNVCRNCCHWTIILKMTEVQRIR